MRGRIGSTVKRRVEGWACRERGHQHDQARTGQRSQALPERKGGSAREHGGLRDAECRSRQAVLLLKFARAEESVPIFS